MLIKSANLPYYLLAADALFGINPLHGAIGIGIGYYYNRLDSNPKYRKLLIRPKFFEPFNQFLDITSKNMLMKIIVVMEYLIMKLAVSLRRANMQTAAFKNYFEPKSRRVGD